MLMTKHYIYMTLYISAHVGVYQHKCTTMDHTLYLMNTKEIQNPKFRRKPGFIRKCTSNFTILFKSPLPTLVMDRKELLSTMPLTLRMYSELTLAKAESVTRNYQHLCPQTLNNNLLRLS